MPCEILIAAEDKNTSRKGYPCNIVDTPYEWGRLESKLGGYIILRVPDATKAETIHFLRQWKKTFTYSIVNENQNGYRIRVEVDPAVVSTSGNNRSLRAGMKEYVRDAYGAVVKSYTEYEVVLDIPKPLMISGVESTFQEMKEDIADKFDDIVDKRHYYFDSVDVDAVFATETGIVERTKAQVIASIRNKLDD